MTPATVGDFDGATLTLDPETGFLTKSNNAVESSRDSRGCFVNGFESVSVFTVSVKLNVLKILLDTWNISKACSLSGVSRWTFTNHYAVDESFRQCVDEIHNRHVDAVDQVRHDVALKPSGAFDRMALLNAYRPEVYNPKVKIEVEHTVSREEGARRLNVLSHAVDAEIVDTVQKIKAQRARARRRQNPNGHGDPK
jgi:hypothetical protein